MVIVFAFQVRRRRLAHQAVGADRALRPGLDLGAASPVGHPRGGLRLRVQPHHLGPAPVGSRRLTLPGIGMIASWSVARRRRPAGPAAGPWPADVRCCSPPATGGVTTGPDVSVIVPVRNEATRLPRLLELLQASEPPPHEVIVVDDGSTDATARLAREAGHASCPCRRHRVGTGSPGPAGKGPRRPPATCSCSSTPTPSRPDMSSRRWARRDARRARLRPAPPSRRALVRAALGGAGADLVPRGRRRPATPSVAGGGDRWPSVRRSPCGGTATRRSADTTRCGPTSPRTSRSPGWPTPRERPSRTLLGGEALSYRMYPDGLRSLADGWSKNLAAGARSMPPLRLLATVLWVTAALQAPLLLASPAAPVGGPRSCGRRSSPRSPCCCTASAGSGGWSRSSIPWRSPGSSCCSCGRACSPCSAGPSTGGAGRCGCTVS